MTEPLAQSVLNKIFADFVTLAEETIAALSGVEEHELAGRIANLLESTTNEFGAHSNNVAPHHLDGQASACAREDAPHIEIQLVRTLASIRSLAAHCSDALVSAVLDWYDSGNATSTNVSQTTLRNSVTSTSTVPSRQSAFAKARKWIPGLVFFRAMQEILVNFRGDNIAAERTSRIENHCISAFKAASAALPAFHARELVHNVSAGGSCARGAVWATLLLAAKNIESLSRSRLMELLDTYVLDITTRFTSNAGKLEIARLIPSMCRVKLSLQSQRSVSNAARFLNTLLPYMTNAKRIELKHAFCYTFAHVLENLEVSDQGSQVDLNELYVAASSLYQKALYWSRKAKHVAACIPLLVSILNMSSKSFFVKNMWQVLDLCYKNTRSKDPYVSATAFANVARLLRGFLRKFDSVSQALLEHLQSIVDKLLFPKKNSILLGADSATVEHILPSVLEIARGKIDFCLQNVILELFARAKSEPAALLLALRSLRGILDLSDSCAQRMHRADAQERGGQPQLSREALDISHYKPAIRPHIAAALHRAFHVLALRESTRVEIPWQLPAWCSRIAAAGSGKAGQTLLGSVARTFVAEQDHTLRSALEGDATVQVRKSGAPSPGTGIPVAVLAVATLECAAAFAPDEVLDVHLVENAIHVAMHRNARVAAAGTNCLRQLMVQRPEAAADMVSRASSIAMDSVVDTDIESIGNAALLIRSLAQQWRDLLADGADQYAGDSQSSGSNSPLRNSVRNPQILHSPEQKTGARDIRGQRPGAIALLSPRGDGDTAYTSENDAINETAGEQSRANSSKTILNTIHSLDALSLYFLNSHHSSVRREAAALLLEVRDIVEALQESTAGMELATPSDSGGLQKPPGGRNHDEQVDFSPTILLDIMLEVYRSSRAGSRFVEPDSLAASEPAHHDSLAALLRRSPLVSAGAASVPGTDSDQCTERRGAAGDDTTLTAITERHETAPERALYSTGPLLGVRSVAEMHGPGALTCNGSERDSQRKTQAPVWEPSSYGKSAQGQTGDTVSPARADGPNASFAHRGMRAPAAVSANAIPGTPSAKGAASDRDGTQRGEITGPTRANLEHPLHSHLPSSIDLDLLAFITQQPGSTERQQAWTRFMAALLLECIELYPEPVAIASPYVLAAVEAHGAAIEVGRTNVETNSPTFILWSNYVIMLTIALGRESIVFEPPAHTRRGAAPSSQYEPGSPKEMNALRKRVVKSPVCDEERSDAAYCDSDWSFKDLSQEYRAAAVGSALSNATANTALTIGRKRGAAIAAAVAASEEDSYAAESIGAIGLFSQGSGTGAREETSSAFDSARGSAAEAPHDGEQSAKELSDTESKDSLPRKGTDDSLTMTSAIFDNSPDLSTAISQQQSTVHRFLIEHLVTVLQHEGLHVSQVAIRALAFVPAQFTPLIVQATRPLERSISQDKSSSSKARRRREYVRYCLTELYRRLGERSTKTERLHAASPFWISITAFLKESATFYERSNKTFTQYGIKSKVSFFRCAAAVVSLHGIVDEIGSMLVEDLMSLSKSHTGAAAVLDDERLREVAARTCRGAPMAVLSPQMIRQSERLLADLRVDLCKAEALQCYLRCLAVLASPIPASSASMPSVHRQEPFYDGQHLQSFGTDGLSASAHSKAMHKVVADVGAQAMFPPSEGRDLRREAAATSRDTLLAGVALLLPSVQSMPQALQNCVLDVMLWLSMRDEGALRWLLSTAYVEEGTSISLCMAALSRRAEMHLQLPDLVLSCPVAEMINTTLIGLGSNVAPARAEGVAMLHILARQLAHTSAESTPHFPLCIAGFGPAAISRTQFDVSERLSYDFSFIAPQVFLSSMRRFASLSEVQQKATLTFLLPWMKQIDLTATDESTGDAMAHDVLEALYSLTKAYVDRLPLYIEDLWASLTSDPENIVPATKFLLLRIHNASKKDVNTLSVHLEVARHVALFLSRAETDDCAQCLLAEIDLDTIGPIITAYEKHHILAESMERRPAALHESHELRPVALRAQATGARPLQRARDTTGDTDSPPGSAPHQSSVDGTASDFSIPADSSQQVSLDRAEWQRVSLSLQWDEVEGDAGARVGQGHEERDAQGMDVGRNGAARANQIPHGKRNQKDSADRRNPSIWRQHGELPTGQAAEQAVPTRLGKGSKPAGGSGADSSRAAQTTIRSAEWTPTVADSPARGGPHASGRGGNISEHLILKRGRLGTTVDLPEADVLSGVSLPFVKNLVAALEADPGLLATVESDIAERVQLADRFIHANHSVFRELPPWIRRPSSVLRSDAHPPIKRQVAQQSSSVKHDVRRASMPSTDALRARQDSTVGQETPIALLIYEIALILLVDIVYESTDTIRHCLPRVLHTAAVLTMSPKELVASASRSILAATVHGLTVRQGDALGESVESEFIREEAINVLEAVGTLQLQDTEDSVRDVASRGTAALPTTSSAIDTSGDFVQKMMKTPLFCDQNLPSVVERINNLLDPDHQLHEKWASVALSSATALDGTMYGAISHAIYRSLHPIMSYSAALRLLSICSTALANPSPASIVQIVDVARSLTRAIALMDAKKLLLYAQVLWGCCALLQSPFTAVFNAVSVTLLQILLKLDLTEENSLHIVLAALPKAWEGSFRGLLPIVAGGLASPTSAVSSLRLTCALAQIRAPEITGPDSESIFLHVAVLIPALSIRIQQNVGCADSDLDLADDPVLQQCDDLSLLCGNGANPVQPRAGQSVSNAGQPSQAILSHNDTHHIRSDILSLAVQTESDAFTGPIPLGSAIASLSAAADSSGFGKLGTVLRRLARNDYTSVDEFLSEIRRPFCDDHIRNYRPKILTVLLDVLEGGPASWAVPTLTFMRELLLNVPLGDPDTVEVSNRVIAAARALLGTPCYAHAARLLDAIVHGHADITGVVPTLADERKFMARRSRTRSILFGRTVPSSLIALQALDAVLTEAAESGSVPASERTSLSTRGSIHLMDTHSLERLFDPENVDSEEPKSSDGERLNDAYRRDSPQLSEEPSSTKNSLTPEERTDAPNEVVPIKPLANTEAGPTSSAKNEVERTESGEGNYGSASADGTLNEPSDVEPSRKLTGPEQVRRSSGHQGDFSGDGQDGMHGSQERDTRGQEPEQETGEESQRASEQEPSIAGETSDGCLYGNNATNESSGKEEPESVVLSGAGECDSSAEFAHAQGQAPYSESTDQQEPESGRLNEVPVTSSESAEEFATPSVTLHSASLHDVAEMDDKTIATRKARNENEPTGNPISAASSSNHAMLNVNDTAALANETSGDPDKRSTSDTVSIRLSIEKGDDSGETHPPPSKDKSVELSGVEGVDPVGCDDAVAQSADSGYAPAAPSSSEADFSSPHSLEQTNMDLVDTAEAQTMITESKDVEQADRSNGESTEDVGSAASPSESTAITSDEALHQSRTSTAEQMVPEKQSIEHDDQGVGVEGPNHDDPPVEGSATLQDASPENEDSSEAARTARGASRSRSGSQEPSGGRASAEPSAPSAHQPQVHACETDCVDDDSIPQRAVDAAHSPDTGAAEQDDAEQRDTAPLRAEGQSAAREGSPPAFEEPTTAPPPPPDDEISE